MKNESKKNNRKYIIIIMNIIVCLSLSSCSYGELSRTDRESYGEVIDSNFESDKWQKYMVNDVLFTLSIMENNLRTYEVSSSFQKFRIYADAYKEKSDESKVTINSIKLEGKGKIKFVDRYEVIDKEIEFEEDPRNENLMGVKALLNASKNVRNVLIFNLLSYMSDSLLTKGNTFASIDELYLFLGNLTMVEYIRNFMKRVRKKESSVILATQNIEDFNLPKVKEYTKPLFAIPTYKFIFNCGETDPKVVMDLLQLTDSEFSLIKHPSRGQCLFKAGIETFNLQVKAPKYKSELFGDAGGR